LRRTFITDGENAGAASHEMMAMSGRRSEAVYKRYAISKLYRSRAALGLTERCWGKQDGHNSGTDLSSELSDVIVIS
jgi:hypothetical protein